MLMDGIRWGMMLLSLTGGLLTPSLADKWRFWGFTAWFISNMYWLVDAFARQDYQMGSMYIFFQGCNLKGMYNNYRGMNLK